LETISRVLSIRPTNQRIPQEIKLRFLVTWLVPNPGNEKSVKGRIQQCLLR